MFCTTGQVVFIDLDRVDKTYPSTLVLTSSQSYFLVYIRGDMESMYPEFALYGSKNVCAWTETVFSPYLRSTLGQGL